MFSSERAVFRGSVLSGGAAPAPASARRVEPAPAAAAWLPDDLVDDAAFAEFPDFGAASHFGGASHVGAAAVELDPAALEAQRAAEEAEWRAAEEERLAAEAAEAEARREQELGEAYAAGVEAGRAEGEAAAREEIDPIAGALLQALADVREGEQRWLATLQENVAALAIAVARHVIGREVAADPSSVAELVRHAVAEYPVDEPLTARVAPQDVAALKAMFAAYAGESAAPLRELRWVADAHVARGGVLVEGRERIVDGRVDTALERVYRRLAGQSA
jgi:flagellar assembly protein FliH